MNERRQERIGHNEALFRRVNERLEEVNDAFASIAGDFDIVCECGDIDCDDRIVMSRPAYEALRADPRRFAIVHDHVATDVEDVVERHERYSIVQKHPGYPAEIASATKPPER